MKRLLLALTLLSGFMLSGAASVAAGLYARPAGLGEESVVFPDDANIRNVKAAPYNAKGDGVTDDSEAIQAAFNAPGLVYFPNGTYLVSKPFEPPRVRGKVPSRRILQGQSMAGVVIKLKDNTPAFGNPAAPQQLFRISYAPEQAFRNTIRNMTFDTGKGNPGAIGMQFYASNQGGMHHVTIRSGDGQGQIGLDLNFSGPNGPLFINDIRVLGFDTGIDGGSAHLDTFEHVRVENQNKIGFYAQSYAFVRGFSSVQKKLNVPAVVTRGHSLVTLIDAQCEGTGGAAVVGDGKSMLVRNLDVTGYDLAIKRGAQEIKGPKVTEWTAQPVNTLFPSPPRSLNLPIKETPGVPWDDPKTWANVLRFLPDSQKPENRAKNQKFDITEAFQKAIDSGATTVYFPQLGAKNDSEKYHLEGTVFVRGNVRRIFGCESEFREATGGFDNKDDDVYDAQLGKDTAAKIVIEKGAAPVVLIERFDFNYGNIKIENRSPRTLVVSSLASTIYLAPGAGDLFIEDCITTYLDINGQNVWARQLNAERGVIQGKPKWRPNIRQNGGTLWLHGLKTEADRVKLELTNGAAEVSAFLLANRATNPLPMFVSTDSRFSVSFAEDVLRKGPFDIAVRETRGNVTREFTHAMAPKDGEGKFVSLFVGDAGGGTVPPASPGNLTAVGQSTGQVALNWKAANGSEGYLIEQKTGAEWKSVRAVRADETSVVLNGLTPATAYQFRVVAFNGKGQAISNESNASTLAPAPPGTGTGLRAEYYGTQYFAQRKETKTDAQINFDWKTAPPAGLKAGEMAVRWTGWVEPRFSEDYTFSVPAEGARLWLGDTLVLNATGRTRKATVPLEAGKKVALKFEWFGERDTAAVLSWQSASQQLEAVPNTQLYPAGEALPAVTLAASNTQPAEGETVVLSIRREGGAAALAVPYSVGGNAVPGHEYKALSGSVELAAGNPKTEFPLEVLDDKIGEADKNLTITLAQSARYNVNGPPVSLLIRDNDLPPAGNGTGLKAEYFSDPDFTGLKGTRIDKTIDFNWDKKQPFPGVDAAKPYAIRWTGQIQPLFSETYVLSANTTVYGATKVFIDGRLLFDFSAKGGTNKAEIALKAGQKYDLKVEFVNRRFYGSKIRLEWKSPSQFEQVVPAGQLYPAP